MKKMTALLLASVMTVSLAACGGNDDDDAASSGPGTQITAAEKDETEATHTIKIGVFEPTTGENSNGGKQEVLGIRYANAIVPTVELNGTVYNIELVEADNQSDKVAAVAAAESLIVEGVAGVIGSYGSGVSNAACNPFRLGRMIGTFTNNIVLDCCNFNAAGQTFADANVPAIGASCTNPQVTAGNKYYFRTTFMDPFQGRVIASYAAEQGYRTAAVISQNGDDYSTGIAAYFRQAFTDEKIGGKVVADEAYHAGETEFDEILQKIQKTNPDCIFLPCSTAMAEVLLPQIRESGITAPVLAADTWENLSMVKAIGEAAEGVVFSSPFEVSATTQAKTFVRGFQSYLRQNAERIALNGGTDEVAAVSALGYDAYMTMVTALESLDGTKDVLTSVDLRNALYEVDYEGVTGDISFDDNGDAIRDTAYLKQIQNGKFVFLKKQVDETE